MINNCYIFIRQVEDILTFTRKNQEHKFKVTKQKPYFGEREECIFNEYQLTRI